MKCLNLTLVLCCTLIIFHLVDLFPKSNAQLDLPSMPGPPYPDPRGQNRWGVKFDPRKHGPPFDQRGRGSGSASHSHHRRPPPNFRHQRPNIRPPRNNRPPPRAHPQQYQDNRGQFTQQYNKQQGSPFYSNNINSNSNGGKYYHSKVQQQNVEQSDSNNGRGMGTDGQQFWNAWNFQYKKKSGKYQKDAAQAQPGPTKYWNMIKNIWNNNNNNNGGDKGKSNMAQDSSAFGYQIDIAHPKRPGGGGSGSGSGGGSGKGNWHRQGDQNWKVFSTIGRGLDAVHGRVRTVRKAVLGTSTSVLASGMKIGGKVAVFGAKKVAHVGANILANKVLESAVAKAIATAG